MPDRDPSTYIKERKLQANVTINNNLLLDWTPFHDFYSGLRKRKKRITVFNGFSPNCDSPKMYKFPNF